jgi:hypothetical protein
LSADAERAIGALASCFASWRAPESRWRTRLADALPTYSRQVIERGVREGVRDWTEAALRELRRREVPPGARTPGLVAVWLASSVPTAVFSAIGLPLLVGKRVYARPSSADLASAELFAESLVVADPQVGASLEIGSGDGEHVLDQADAVIVYGRDETVEELRGRVGDGRIFIGHGHKLSVAAIGPHADVTSAARGVALDAALFDGRGCLSPSYVLVVESRAGRARAVAQALAGELEVLRTGLPRGRASDAEELALREWRTRAALAGDEVWLAEGSTAWGVALARDKVSPGTLRHLPVIGVPDVGALGHWCARLAPHLSSLGVEGFAADDGRLRALTERAGGSRVCPLGSMQLPPLDWRNDGVGPLADLVRT